MALQIRPVSINWTDEFTNPARYEAAIRNNLASNNSPAVQQAVRSTPVSAPVQQAQQQIVQQQQAQRFVAPQVSAPATQAPNFWGTIGGFLGADAFKRTGEGIAEIIAELNGTNQRMRDQKAQQDQQDLTLIRHYGDLIKNGDPNTKQRAQQALASLMRTSDTADKDFQARQQQIIERTDPVKGAAALGEIGLNIVTAGVGGTAAKTAVNTGKFLTKGLAKDAAIGAATGFGSGIAGAYQVNGAAANDDPNTFTSGLIGGAVGGGLPIVGKVAGKFVNSVINKEASPVAQELTDNVAALEGKAKPKVTLKQLEKKAKTKVLDINERQQLKDLRAEQAVVNEVKAAVQESELTQASGRLKKGSRGQISSKVDGIDENDPFGNRNVLTRIKNELGQHFVEDNNKMLRLLGRIEKETGRTGLVDQYYYDTGRIRVANAIADARVAGSEDIHTLFKGMKDFSRVGRKLRQLAGQDGKSELDRFDDYAAARAELQNYKGKKTSKSREELAGIVVNGHKEFGERFDAMNRFYKDQAKYLYENGIISKKKMDYYQKNPDYIRIQRDVEDLVNQGTVGGKTPQLNSTTTSQRRKGSARTVLSPSRTLLERSQQMELEVQRNRAANHTIDVLQEAGLARRVADSNGKNTIGRYRGGKKEFWEVPKDVKEEMSNLNPYSMGPVMQIISMPNRLLRAGATGLNVPFAGANFLKDQVGSAIQSKYAWQTHDPRNIVSGLWQATRDFGSEANDPLWKKFEEFTGNQTIYDELRNQKATNATLRELRLGKKGVAINRAMSPVRSLEDLIGITEKATRFQNFKGTYQKVLTDTGNEKLALQQATIAARKNTTDFNRAGDWGRVLNGFIPYFNASIQGSRSMARAFKERPIATSIKTVGTVALPTIAATLWNYADPARAEVYNSIDDYEKKDNWIIVGPDAHQNKDGSWSGVVKIPKPPGYRDLTDPVRDVTEGFIKGQSPADAGRLLSDVLNAFGGPVQTGNLQQLEGSLLPQQVKPFIQAQMNKNLYTGKDIVPEFMNQATHPDGTPVANSDKAYTDTSGTSRALGKLFGVSPLIVDQFIRDSTASVGQYVQNTADQLGAAAGAIPKNQIGGKDILSDIEGRFAKANGTLLERNKTEGQKYFEARKEATKDLSPADMKAFDTLHPQTKNFLGEQVYDADSIYNSAKRLALYNTNPNIFQADKKLDAYARSQGSPGNPLFDLSGDNLKKVLEKGNLPPGAKDPELSSLYTKDWFVEYQNKKTAYYDYVAKQAAASGKPLGGSDNPYPTTPANVQQDMDYYNGLPKGTGARSGWIKANPDKWAAMQAQFAAVDNWQNEQRKKRGLDATEGAAGQANGYSTGSSSGGYSGGYGSRKSKAGINQYAYQVKRGGATVSLKAPKASVGAPKIAKAKISKPKVTLKKAAA